MPPLAIMLSNDEFKAVCPPHRLKDLEPLVKTLKGDEEKIRATIEEWWDEPEQVEPEWEDVNKKGSKRGGVSSSRQNGGLYRGDRGSRRESGGARGGRGFHRGMGGGRGGGPDRRSRDYTPDKGKYSGRASSTERDREPVGGVPAPVVNVPRPKGAWSQQAVAPEPAKPVGGTPLDVGLVTAQDPTPSGLVDGSPKLKPTPPVPVPEITVSAPRPVTSSGNVWATKGSAHLIEAEKPKAPPAYIPSLPLPQRHPSPQLKTHQDTILPQNGTKKKEAIRPPVRNGGKTTPQHEEAEEALPSQPIPIPQDSTDVVSSPASALVSSIPSPTPVTPIPAEDPDALLPASVNGANVNAVGWTPTAEPETPQSPQLGPAGDVSSVSETGSIGEAPQEEEIPAVEDSDVSSNSALKPAEPVVERVESPPPEVVETSPKAAGILNMGKWDVSEADDDGLDFGFGSFHESDVVQEVEEEEPVVESAPAPVQEPLPQVAEMPLPAVAPPEMSAPPSVSPARPPPGLSITGMPPMPANAVLVHELENKLESASLRDAAAPKAEEPAEVTTATTQAPTSSNTVQSSLSDKSATGVDFTASATQTLQQQPPVVSASYPDAATAAAANPVVPGMSQFATVYGMGMYNQYPSSLGNAFVGMHAPAGPVLAGGVLPQQQKPQQQQPTTTSAQQQQQQTGTAQPSVPQQHHQQQQQGGLYGAPSTGTAPLAQSETPTPAETGSNAALPPGIHGAMYNPALYYGQQHYQMGQPHVGGGYGYGYGAQYGGAVGGGFGYQQVMSQNGAYGQPYDDSPQQLHTNQQSHHTTSSAYQKSGSGYRGRSSHHSTHHTSHGSAAHQYQSQYNPQQHGAYAAQPYMAYGVDHFSQRGGYGPSMDPYIQQGSGYQSGVGHTSGYNSQEDSEQLQHKGKRGGQNRNAGFGSNNPNIQQFQQQVPPQQQGVQSQQQSYGLQGSVSESTSGGGSSNAGWSNQRWVATNWQGS